MLQACSHLVLLDDSSHALGPGTMFSIALGLSGGTGLQHCGSNAVQVLLLSPV